MNFKRVIVANKEITLNGVPATDRLTPKLAWQAARIAGYTGNVTVWDADGSGYRLYERTTRKLRRDSDNT